MHTGMSFSICLLKSILHGRKEQQLFIRCTVFTLFGSGKFLINMNVYIKNMVCLRCKMAVQSILEALDIDYVSIELGIVKLAGELSPEQQRKLNKALSHYELELMDNKKMILVERIKTLIIDTFRSSPGEMRLKFSEHLSKSLGYDYTYLANVFSETEGSTIERFYILTRTERVKELIVYEALSIKEIAYQLNFSSVSHLCLQFKKVTGQTPSMFKKLCDSQDYVWRTCE
ncbi:MAG: AraC family transcriptional regulator [Bacteroidota bacterium]